MFDKDVQKEFVAEKLGTVGNPTFLNWLDANGFYLAPAAKSHHSNVANGLYCHSVNVARTLENLTTRLDLKWDRPESPWVVGLLHDVCKMDDYRYRIYNEGHISDIAYDPTMPGHGEKSIFMLYGLVELTEEEKDCIRYHMGAYTDKSEWKFYNYAIKRHPNVLYTHMADMIASNIMEVSEI